MKTYTNGSRTIRASEKMYNLIYKEQGFKPEEKNSQEVIIEESSQEVITEETSQEVITEETSQDINFEKLTVEELKNLAKEKGLEGYSKLKKDELIKLLKGDQ